MKLQVSPCTLPSIMEIASGKVQDFGYALNSWALILLSVFKMVGLKIRRCPLYGLPWLKLLLSRYCTEVHKSMYKIGKELPWSQWSLTTDDTHRPSLNICYINCPFWGWAGLEPPLLALGKAWIYNFGLFSSMGLARLKWKKVCCPAQARGTV